MRLNAGRAVVGVHHGTRVISWKHSTERPGGRSRYSADVDAGDGGAAVQTGYLTVIAVEFSKDDRNVAAFRVERA